VRGVDANSRDQTVHNTMNVAIISAVPPISHANDPSAKYIDLKPRLKFIAARMFNSPACAARGNAIGSLRVSGLPAIASTPPIARIEVDAKNAVPCRKLPKIWLSKMRGSRVTNTFIQSRRRSAIKTLTDGRPKDGCSILQPIMASSTASSG